MKEAPQKGSGKKQGPDDDKVFEETFRPKNERVNFGVLKNEKVKKAKRPRKKRTAVLLILVLLIGGAGAALYFTGFLSPVLERIGLAEPAAETQMTLEERETLVASKEAELDKREESLDQREEQIEALAEAQKAEDVQPEDAEDFGDRISSLSDEELAYLKKVSSIYSKMDPVQAAAIMGSIYDLNEISSILYYMQPAAAALVLEQMEADKAADITEIMLN